MTADDIRFECAVAAAAMALNAVQSSPGATQADLMRLLTMIFIEAMETCEREARFRKAFLPSAN